jgi:4-hydroxy-3-methylbut-2-enyl diphosphate reductase
MKIVIAKDIGFCYGIKRARDIIYSAVEKYPQKKIYSYREIIHNPQEMKRIKTFGVHVVYDLNEIEKDSIVIISTHGITPEEEKILKNKKSTVVDTTCPYVKRTHNIVEHLAKNNYEILVVGDRRHFEVKGIIGHCHGSGMVISSFSDMEKIKAAKKTGVVAQTTQNAVEYKKIITDIINSIFKIKQMELRVFNTICDATYKRQKATIRIAQKADIVIVIGGRNSANTRRLYELSKDILKDVYLIETAEEIKKEWFKNKKVLGISAGASTPDWIIKDVVNKIKELKF